MNKLSILLFFIALFFSVPVNAQDYGNKVDPLKLCIAIQSNNFISDAEAENALDRILSVIGASKRFVLQSCDNIDNAVAVSYKGVRYILYDKEFMNSISRGDNWGNLFILAHEVGHHVNGHSLDLVLYATEVLEAETLISRRQQELEADEFAGFVLGKLGASLVETISVLNFIANDRDDTYSTHPSKTKRINAIKKGFNKALLTTSFSTGNVQKTVTGKVLDEFGMGLPGVSILVKGTTTGTTTNIDGEYSIEVPNDQGSLLFSFVGYTPFEQVVGAKSVLNLTLTPSGRRRR
jgi:hypothetical protein